MRFLVCKAGHTLYEDRGTHAAVVHIEEEDIILEERNARLTCRVQPYTARELTNFLNTKIREIFHLHLDGTIEDSNATWYYDSIKRARKTTILWLLIARRIHLPRDVAKLIGLEVLKTRYSIEWFLLKWR